MPVIDLNSKDLWTKITKVLDADKEHVCVLPMTTFIKPVRTITVLQTDTSVTSTRTECPPGSVDLAAEPKPEPKPEPEAAPEPEPQPEPQPDPEPELADPRIVSYDEMRPIVSKLNLNDVLNAAYNRDAPLMVRGSAFGVVNKGTLTVGMDWNDNPGQAVIIQVEMATGKLLAHKRGRTRYYFKVNEVEGTTFDFVGQSGTDRVDVANFE